jgi:hypothetical protein
MKAMEILNYIPRKKLEFLALESNVDFKAKKLDGIVMFQLLIYSMLSTKQGSLRVMEEFFSSFSFQKLAYLNGESIRYSSLSERLNSINVEFFEKLYEECGSQFSKFFDAKEDNILRFDSTLVSISGKLVDIGFRAGSHKGNKKQLKFTLGLSNLPSTAKFFHESSYNSEDIALKEAILASENLKEKIIVFDRGIQSRDTFDNFTNQSIQFVTRIKTTVRHQVLKERNVSGLKNEKILIISDQEVNLFNKNYKKTQGFLRLIKASIIGQEKEIYFLTNIEGLSALEIAEIYKQRWEIEVFFKFLKQELNFSHLISRNINGIKVVLYTTLIAAILLTVYKKLNNLKGYKIPKLKFSNELENNIMIEIVKLCGGDPSKLSENQRSP